MAKEEVEINHHHPCGAASMAWTNISWTLEALRPKFGSSHSVYKYQ
jgi:hypothetical protein